MHKFCVKLSVAYHTKCPKLFTIFCSEIGENGEKLVKRGGIHL